MPDRAVSDHPGVQRQLDRLALLSPGADILGLERIQVLLQRLGHPERRLPPVFHVAGTNGKGSTCAFLRAAVEAAGLSAHVYTSPHLLRFNERIRIAGKLIDDDLLASLLEEVLDQVDGIETSFFEATTAAAFLAFSRIEANACIVEVGLGGRLDATNVLPAPVACGIAQLGIDHQYFLGDRIEGIAAEKAGIAKRGSPLVTQLYAGPLAQRIGEAAAAAGAHWLPRGGRWDASSQGGEVHYRDEQGNLKLPRPLLAGPHQAMNAALAVAMLRHQQKVPIPQAALLSATEKAVWPARLQQLDRGPLRDLLPTGSELWLDGGHNPAAAAAIAAFFRNALPSERPLHLVFGLLENKDAAGVLEPFAGLASTLYGVPVTDHPCHSPLELAEIASRLGIGAHSASGPAEALATIARYWKGAAPPIVLILGSLYLAGEILRENGQVPD